MVARHESYGIIQACMIENWQTKLLGILSLSYSLTVKLRVGWSLSLCVLVENTPRIKYIHMSTCIFCRVVLWNND